jgi:hypothetical protein
MEEITTVQWRVFLAVTAFPSGGFAAADPAASIRHGEFCEFGEMHVRDLCISGYVGSTGDIG